MPCWMTRASTPNCWAKILHRKCSNSAFCLALGGDINHSTHTMSSAASITLFPLLKAWAECSKTHWNTQKWITHLQISECHSDKQSLQFKFKRTALQVSVQHLCEKLVESAASTNLFFFLSICLNTVENKQCNTTQEIKHKCRLPYRPPNNFRWVDLSTQKDKGQRQTRYGTWVDISVK